MPELIIMLKCFMEISVIAQLLLSTYLNHIFKTETHTNVRIKLKQVIQLKQIKCGVMVVVVKWTEHLSSTTTV